MIDVEPVTKTALFSFAAPLIVGVVQGIKQMCPPSWSKYMLLPALALGLLVAFGAAEMFPPQPWVITVLEGIGLGGFASGMFSGVRAMARPT